MASSGPMIVATDLIWCRQSAALPLCFVTRLRMLLLPPVVPPSDGSPSDGWTRLRRTMAVAPAGAGAPLNLRPPEEKPSSCKCCFSCAPSLVDSCAQLWSEMWWWWWEDSLREWWRWREWWRVCSVAATDGGGVSVADGATLAVSNTAAFSANSAGTDGGGIAARDTGTTVTMTDTVTLDSNEAGVCGGAFALGHGATASAAKSIEERREFANQQYQLGRKAFERGDLVTAEPYFLRAAEHAPRGPYRVLERRHRLAEIVGCGASVLVERKRIIPPHPERESIILSENAPRHRHHLAQHRLGFFVAL